MGFFPITRIVTLSRRIYQRGSHVSATGHKIHRDRYRLRKARNCFNDKSGLKLINYNYHLNSIEKNVCWSTDQIQNWQVHDVANNELV